MAGPLIDLYKWTGMKERDEDRAFEKELARERRKLELTDEFRSTAEQKDYQKAKDRFVQNEYLLDAMHSGGTSDPAELSRNAEARWAQQFNAKGMAGVKDYLATTGEIPGARTAAMAAQDAVLAKNLKSAAQDRGGIPGASTLGEAQTTAETVKAVTETKRAGLEGEKIAGEMPRARSIAEKGSAQAEQDLDWQKTNKANAQAVAERVAQGAADRTMEAINLAQQQERSKATLLGAQAGLASSASNRANAMSLKDIALDEAKANSQLAGYEWMAGRPEFAAKAMAPLPWYMGNTTSGASSGAPGTSPNTSAEPRKKKGSAGLTVDEINFP